MKEHRSIDYLFEERPYDKYKNEPKNWPISAIARSAYFSLMNL